MGATEKLAGEALETLRLLLMDDEASDAARVAAAKALLERFAPKQDEETQQREAEERQAALAEASGILADLAAAKLAGVSEPVEMDTKRKTAATHTKSKTKAKSKK